MLLKYDKQATSKLNEYGTEKVADLLPIILICIYYAISIFEQYINGIIGTITKYYIFFIILVLLSQQHGSLHLTPTAKAMVVWLLYKFLTLLWSRNYSTPTIHYVSQIGMVMFLLVLFSNEYEEKAIDWIETIYWISSGALGLFSLFFARSYHGKALARQVLVVAGIEADPNNQAAFLIVGICISVVNLVYKRKWIIPSVIILLINIYGCFLTGSRAGLITITTIAFFCVLLPDKKKKAIIIVGRVALVSLLIYLALFLAKMLDQAVYERLFSFEEYEYGSGRPMLWENAWTVYSENLISILVGIGWGTASIATGMGKETGVHNTFLTMLCDVGLIGTLVFFVPIFIMAYRLEKKRFQLPVMLLISMFIPSFFIDAINKRFFWNAIFLLGIYYYHYIGSPIEKADSHSKYIKS